MCASEFQHFSPFRKPFVKNVGTPFIFLFRLSTKVLVQEKNVCGLAMSWLEDSADKILCNACNIISKMEVN